MFEFLKFGKWRKWAEEKITALELELKRFATKGEVEEIAREVTELNVALDRIEKDVIAKAHKEVEEAVNVELRLFRSEVSKALDKLERMVEGFEQDLEALEKCRETMEDYKSFRIYVKDELERINSELKVLKAVIERLDGEVRKLKKRQSPARKKVRKTVRAKAGLSVVVRAK